MASTIDNRGFSFSFTGVPVQGNVCVCDPSEVHPIVLQGTFSYEKRQHRHSNPSRTKGICKKPVTLAEWRKY